MFATIAPRYDLANRLLSMGLDQRWRKALIEALPPLRAGDRVLDQCTGTGDVAVSLAQALPDDVEIHGSDFCEGMVELAPAKRTSPGVRPAFLVGDALHLPYPDGSFVACTIAFGLRNVQDPPQALAEVRRLIKPGGRLLVLEFSKPTQPVFAAFYRFYVFRLLPLIGGLITGSRAAYAYLPESVWAWPTPDVLGSAMEEAGLRVIEQRPFLFGAVMLHVAERPHT